MKPRFAALLLPTLLAGCAGDSATSPALESRVFNVLGGLEVGEALTLQGADAQEVFLAGSQAGREYLYVPFFAAEDGAATLNVEVAGTDVLGSGSSASLAPAPSSAMAGLRIPGVRLRNNEFHQRLEARLRPQLNRVMRGMSPAQRDLSQPSQVVTSVANANVGDTVTLRTGNFAAASDRDFCRPVLRPGRVVAKTERALVVADLKNPNGDFSAAEYQRIAQEFDQLVYPVNERNFGAPTDRDGNGRVILFFSPVVNQLTPPGTADREGYVAGFFSAIDLFPNSELVFEDQAGEFSCPISNQGEIFYLLAADPSGAFGNRFGTAEVARSSSGVVGHELQHLINASRRLYVTQNATSFEEGWLNEGLSHIAEELLFYQVTGLQPRMNLGRAAVQQHFDAWLRYQYQNFARYASYLENPDEESLMGAENFLETRGAVWAFLRYAADHKQGADRDFWFALVNSRVAGLRNLNDALRQPARDLMQKWTVSVYTDDYVERVDSVYTQPSWNFRTALQIFRAYENSFPLEVERLTPGSQVRLTLLGGGAAFVEARVGGEKQAVIRTTSNSSAPPGSLRISVVRIR